MHKGEKEKMFAYNVSTFCDKNGFIITNYTAPANLHDSVTFYGMYDKVLEEYKDKIENVCLDAGYVNSAICKKIFDNEHIPIMPYKRPMTKKGFFKKYEFVYDEYFNCYICPNNKILKYTTTTREGYRQYKSNPEECKYCPYLNKCTHSKNKQKLIQRHIWEKYKEEANHLRYVPEYKELYKKRKETIERQFANGKENHCLRYTRHRGLKRVTDSVTLIFACMNLKKMAKWLIYDNSFACFFCCLFVVFKNLFFIRFYLIKAGILCSKIPAFVNSLKGAKAPFLYT